MSWEYYQVYIISPCIPNSQTSREQAHSSTADRASAGRTRTSAWSGEWVGLFRAAGLLFAEGPADMGTISTYWVTFLFTIYFHRSISTPRKKHPPFFFPVCGWRAGLGRWTSLSNRGVDSCCLLSPGLQGARIPQWEHSTDNSQSLVFIEKALVKLT